MSDIERSFSAAEINTINLAIALGDLSLSAKEGDQIHLRARLRSNDVSELEISVVDGVLTIKNRSESNWLTRNADRIDIALSVPTTAAATISAKTGLGDVSADGVSGLATIHTGKGDVQTANGRGSLVIKTGKGDVAVRAWRGDLDITTGKGDVAVSDLVGGLQLSTGAGDAAVARWQAADGAAHQIKTGSGDVAVRQIQVQRLEIKIGRGDCVLQQMNLHGLDIRTGMGSLNLAGDPLGGRWEARTGKGDLTLALPANTAVRIEAATRQGQVNSELPQVKVARPGPISQHGGRVIVVVGEEPRAEIRLDTHKGDITVRTMGAMPTSAASTSVTVEARPASPKPPSLPASPALPSPPMPAALAMTAMSVLESLERGEINADEAEALLRSLD